MTVQGDQWGMRVSSRWLLAVYPFVHLFLDWISFIHELPPLNITPWNPPSGLAVAVLTIVGPRAVPVVWLSLTAGDALVRGLPVDFGTTLLSNAVIAGTYGFAAWVLCRRFGVSAGLGRVRDVVSLAAVAAIAAAVVGFGYIGLFTLQGLFPWSAFGPILVRHWVGEVIGITVLSPFLLVWLRMPSLHWSWRGVAEVLAQGAAIALALWADFGPLASDQYEYFYILFLPVVWVASRHGLPGATAAVLVTQVGLIVAIQVMEIETARMTHFQFLMLALTITALLLGAVVSERRRSEAWVRERQAEFAHASRLTEAGEMTAALAHEINQPLTAAMSYARAARKIAQRDGAPSQLSEILDKIVAQTERADRVIRSLREFVRKGESRREKLDMAVVIADAIALARPVVEQTGASVVTEIEAGLPWVQGDPIQLQQVLLNLMRNAAEAMADCPMNRRQLTIVASTAGQNGVEVSVRDTGPGLAELVERHLFSPFVTTKETGMGLGLSIARSIIEIHGGTLSAQRLAAGGTSFSFTLPTVSSDER